MSAAVSVAEVGGWVAEAGPDRLLSCLGEVGDLKRITSAGRRGSIAARLFRSAWSSLLAGASEEDAAIRTSAAALAAARLGDLDTTGLAALGLPSAEAVSILRTAVGEFEPALDPQLLVRLHGAAGQPDPTGLPDDLPSFVAALEAQPRAGVTCPGRPRIILQPAESHAEHCLVVAVYGVLLAPRYGADLGTVFLAGLAHHLHNAAMPDSGFTGETLLGPHLEPVMRRATEAALDELAPDLRARIVAARAILPDAATPEGRAFHAADVLDRVLEIAQHLRAAGLTMSEVLGEMGLVHDGPVKPFHDAVLAEMGLA